MKRFHRIICAALAAILSLTLAMPAWAETYPIYEVITRPALLREQPEASEESKLICTVPMNSLVLVARETNGWCLVLTQDLLVGYMQRHDLKPNGKTYEWDSAITDASIAGNQSISIEWITVDPQATLPDETVYRAYPAALFRGDRSFDLEQTLEKLLGAGYARFDGNGYSNSAKYESRDPDKPYRYAYISAFPESFGELQYTDSMVTGERGGEYTPPDINMLPDESIVFCRALLSEIVEPSWLLYQDMERRVSERWSYAERWMTDSEYAKYMKNMDAHYFTFANCSNDGIMILGDGVRASVGVNGLRSLDIFRHDFSVSGDARVTPMPLEEAIRAANSTRLSSAVLLHAELVYSNWLTQNDEFNLSWYLVTSKGNYVVDCVLNEHKCDSYEF